MAALATGQGTTVTFSGGACAAFTAKIRSATIGEEREVFDITHLSTTGYVEKMFGDLKDIPPIEVTFEFDDTDRPQLGAVDTITFTFPGAITLTGTGGVSGWSVPIETKQLMLGTYTVVYDGQTGPTWSG